MFAPQRARSLPANADAVLPAMLGSLEIAPGSQIGVFWETYGVSAGDSIRFQIDFSPADDPSLLRRLGSLLRVVNATTDAVADAVEAAELLMSRWMISPGFSRS